jgi:hypothetical protein
MPLYNWQLQESDGHKAVYTINLFDRQLTKPGHCYHYGADHGVENNIPKITIRSNDMEKTYIPDADLDVSFSIVIHRDKDGAFVPHLYIHTVGPDLLVEMEDVVEEMPNIFISLQSVYDNRHDILHSLEKIVADALSYKSEIILDVHPHDGLDTARFEFVSPHLTTQVTVNWKKVAGFFKEVERV